MKEQNVFIGNCSKNGIYNYKFKNGKLTKNFVQNDFERCTYLSTDNSYLYSVIEEDDGKVISYRKEKDKLEFINQKPSFGKGPCHIEINSNKKLIFVSNYTDGYLTIFKIKPNGGIGDKIYSNVEDKEESHFHCVKISKDDNFFFGVDLGKNLITAYEIEGENIKEVSRVQLKENTQPRHIVVNKDIIYVVTEKSCELYIMKFIDKKLVVVDYISVLPNDTLKQENDTGCAIKITKNLKNIYVTVRGNNSISVYKVNKTKIKMVQNVSCKGDVPRDLELDKKEKYVLVANQKSNNISIFKRNKITGKLVFKRKEEMDSPTCVVIE